jgi:pimeloyl-ACP methyl ester carboxylesterase
MLAFQAAHPQARTTKRGGHTARWRPYQETGLKSQGWRHIGQARTKQVMPDSILFLPGLLCDERLWRNQLAIFPDAIVADLTQDDHVDAMAYRALSQIDGRFALCGLSMGGYVAQAVMRIAPERVTRLALFDTSARADTPEQSRRRRGLMAMTRGNRFRGVTPKLLPQLLHPDRLGDVDLCQDVLDMAERVGREAFLRQQQAILTRPDSRADLPRIAVPTLVAVGEADILTPPLLADEIAGLIPGARLAILPHCAHLPTMERPDDANEILRDWMSHSGHV